MDLAGRGRRAVGGSALATPILLGARNGTPQRGEVEMLQEIVFELGR